MCKLRYTTSIYIQETLSKIYYTLRTFYKHKTPQQPIFAETHFLKQPHTSWLNTPYKISTLMQKPLSLQINATHEITQHISRKLLRMDVLTSETCSALSKKIIKQVKSSWSLFTQILCPLINPVHVICIFVTCFIFSCLGTNFGYVKCVCI